MVAPIINAVGITPSKFSKVKSDFLRGRVSAEKPTPSRKPKLSICEAIGLMENYFERSECLLILSYLSAFIRILYYRVGDHMPDKVAIHLPSMLSRKSVYDRMKQERSDCASLVSQSQFYGLWSQHYPMSPF